MRWEGGKAEGVGVGRSGVGRLEVRRRDIRGYTDCIGIVTPTLKRGLFLLHRYKRPHRGNALHS